MGERRIVGPGKTRGYPYPVCKKKDAILMYVRQEIARLAKSLPDPDDPNGELHVF